MLSCILQARQLSEGCHATKLMGLLQAHRDMIAYCPTTMPGPQRCPESHS